MMISSLKTVPTLLAISLIALTSACMTPMDQSQRLRFLGDPANVAAAVQTIVIKPETKSVVVTGGDIVRFDVNGKSFAWNFDGPGEYNFDLMLIAPPGMLDRKVMIYVHPDPFVNGGY